MRTSSGVARSRIEVSIVLMQPDLPEPVVPAISTCGIRARSVQTALPEMSLPSQTDRGLAVAGRSSKMSPRVARFGEWLGTSTPAGAGRVDGEVGERRDEDLGDAGARLGGGAGGLRAAQRARVRQRVHGVL